LKLFHGDEKIKWSFPPKYCPFRYSRFALSSFHLFLLDCDVVGTPADGVPLGRQGDLDS